MGDKRLNCWEDFEAEISSLFVTLKNRRKETGLHVSSPIFRGQAKESWKLMTTLERYSQKKYSREDYYDILLAIEPAVASFTSKSWNISPDEIIDKAGPSPPAPPPRYDFMIYLRHHGFPSPLLDWSSSPYVAAFFAFQPRIEDKEENIAIYSYIEYYGSAKGGRGDQARIVGLGPYVQTHKRHYIQQCQYTICEKYLDDRYVYSNHEEAFARNEPRQDLLTKYLIPRNDRAKVLSKLDLMNINSYSLFVNEESLMDTLAYREIEKELTDN
jgi:hypothetical protein